MPDVRDSLDPAFGHWLAGFADAEGSFLIVPRKRATSFQCWFSIKLRADDRPVLAAIRDELGFGTLRAGKGRDFVVRNQPSRSHPSAFYWVDSKTAAVRLVDVFDAFPLRAAKSRHYAVWRRAVDVWMRHRPGGTWDDMRELAEELRIERTYDGARQLIRKPPLVAEDEAAFGHWLAGFTDGEGCFGIHLNNGTYQCRFSIQVRADDAPILNQIRDTFGIGNLHFKPRAGGSEERWLLGVRSRADVQKIVSIFDSYPLRAKKRYDYDLWRRAADQWLRHRNGDDWSAMEALAVALREGRDTRLSVALPQ